MKMKASAVTLRPVSALLVVEFVRANKKTENRFSCVLESRYTTHTRYNQNYTIESLVPSKFPGSKCQVAVSLNVRGFLKPAMEIYYDFLCAILIYVFLSLRLSFCLSVSLLLPYVLC